MALYLIFKKILLNEPRNYLRELFITSPKLLTFLFNQNSLVFRVLILNSYFIFYRSNFFILLEFFQYIFNYLV